MEIREIDGGPKIIVMIFLLVFFHKKTTSQSLDFWSNSWEVDSFCDHFFYLNDFSFAYLKIFPFYIIK